MSQEEHEQGGRMLGGGDALLPTEMLPSRSGADLHPSGCWTGHLAVGHVQRADASAGDELAIGQMLSRRYRIERELGEGGMGVVYLAADEQVPGERFAIKVLKKELCPETLTLLCEEVRKTRKLSHPNIVDVHSVNVDGQRLYLLMEYLEGKTLNRLEDEDFGRGIPFSHAWPIIEDVGAALGYAHGHNVIHSDLKPANVLLATSRRTKLLDFGIARASRGPLLQARFGPRALTPAYASCEMLEGKEADRRDDIYSFACVVYEMLCGDRPFGGLTALEAREAGARVQPLTALTQEQNAALAQALAFDRDRRTSSVETLIGALAVDQKPRHRPIALLGTAIIATLFAASLIYVALDKLWVSRHSVAVQTAAARAKPAASPAITAAVSNPPPHTIAVLPFVNISGDKAQDYFSDGLTDELRNSLARLHGLQVTGRTSTFYFKGEHADLTTIARRLNVAAILEGSVRRSEHTVRVSAQLVNAVTGFGLWSQTYDRDLGDLLNVQTEIATAVATALKGTLLVDDAGRIELGGTSKLAAYDAYLRGSRLYYTVQNKKDLWTAVGAYTEAIRVDVNYALAYAARSIALLEAATGNDTALAFHNDLGKARADAQRAITLAPELADGHLALAAVVERSFDFNGARKEYVRAHELAPSSARVQRDYGVFLAQMGQPGPGIEAIRHAVALDPVHRDGYLALGLSQWAARRYDDALATFQSAMLLYPKHPDLRLLSGLVFYSLGKFQNAADSCEIDTDYVTVKVCLAIAYDKLGRRADAESMLAKIHASWGGDAAYQYTMIYAQWGDRRRALDWLETAMRSRTPWLEDLKTDPLMDPLRNEPRFQAIERALKFPG